MKRLILQTYYKDPRQKVDEKVGCYVPADDLARESEARFRRYTESIGADYRMIDQAPYAKYPQPAWARFAIVDIATQEDYDEVCYVDADILPTSRVLGNSIFEFPGVAKKTERDEGARMEWHVNAGVFKLTKRECWKLKSQIFAKPNLRWLENTGKNQDPFNNMYKKGVGRKPQFLNPMWNMTRPYHRSREWMEEHGWDYVDGGYFAHFIGHQKVNGNQWGFVGVDPIAWEDWGTGWTSGFMSQYQQFKDMPFSKFLERFTKKQQVKPSLPEVKL